MKRNAVESVLGAVVLLVASIFVYFAYNTAQVKVITGYNIEARFFKIGGLKVNKRELEKIEAEE